ncbi:hypothetical protein PILCRDRAFT_1874 [Piloderma croceum F 1598]|uniref:ATP-dependent DNA ligase family profile domain-containing protein n=1 Tax=Piloderma croceum (strain F 1598) TaxID=765440 RepID=A0A0C3GIZ0_PILCF|nr:hypothetical protein PILCRDRAFT_1874 [Piloderma croceum F 1598]
MTAERLPGVPFSFFISLLREISQVPPHSTRNSSHPTLCILNRWISELQSRYSPLPRGATAAVFLLLFPEEDTRRKYDMQETRLAQELAKCFGLTMGGRGESLRRWDGEATLGCLGTEVMRVLDEASSDMDDQTSPLTIAEVDALLDELASMSAFTDHSLRKHRSAAPRKRQAILSDLFKSMPALDASFLTQIILKDLRPLLFPLAETHYTAALTKYNTKSVASLSKEDAMRAWDPSGWMLKTYRVRACLYEAANAFQLSSSSDQDLTATPQPRIRTPIEIPKSVKGRGCVDALKHFPNSHKVWAETKYDGERAQIHVEVREDGSSHITIFSKSKRDSTLDRYGIHGIIREALGLSKYAVANECSGSKITQNVILDAEMVAFSSRLQKVDEFWRIRSLISSTARGARGSMFGPLPPQPESHEEPASQASLMSDASDNGTRHLALIFFDVLVLDSVSLLTTPYSSRRSILESLIQTRLGHIMLAERTPIVLNGPGDIVHAGNQLRAIWSRIIAECEEGLVLKADEGGYNDYRSPWVKLKKDYIPGFGDTVDLVIVAASWDKNRARELRVAPTAYTTFYAGALANAKALKTDPSIRPHFEIYFTVSYGQSREQLEEANFLIKNSDPLRYNSSRKAPKGLSYTFNMYPGLPPPAVLFQEPLLVELYGAGFTKAPQSKYYELRFPRLTKLYRAASRPWSEGVTLQDLHKIARESIGRDRSNKDVDDWTKEVWGNVASPGIRCEKKRKEREVGWMEKLAVLEGVGRGKTKRLKVTDSSPCPSPRRDKLLTHKSTTPNSAIRPVLGVKPLGPLFNIAESLSTPPPSNSVRSSPRRALRENETTPAMLPASPLKQRLAKLGTSPFMAHSRQASGSEGMVNIKPKEDGQKLAFGGELVPPVPISTPPSRQIETQFPTPPPSADSTRNVYSSKPIVKFVQDAFVWFAQPCNAPCPTWRPPTTELLVGAYRLHSLESLLTGCGWQAQGVTSSRIKRGVIFIDESTIRGRSWKDYALKTLQERYELLTPGVKRGGIWVFDAKLLGYGALETTEGAVERLVLWRFD